MSALYSSLAGGEEFVRRSVILALLFSIPALMAINSLALMDPDVWWHLRTGQWIVENRAVPVVDHFSAFGMGKPWVAYSWLFEVLLYGLYRLSGLQGLIAYSLILLLLIGVAFYSLVSRFEPRFVNAAALTAVGLFVVGTYITPRPWLFTILFLTLELNIILTARRTGNYYPLALLPLMFVLWANLHIQFVYGLFILGLAFAEPLIDQVSTKSHLFKRGDVIPAKLIGMTLAASLVTPLINPYHLGIYRTVYELATQTGPLTYITELQALKFRFISDWLILFVTMGAAFALGWQRSLRPFTSSLLLAGAFLSFRSTRDAWFVVIIGAAIIASVRAPDHFTPTYRLTKLQVLFITVAVGLAVAAKFRAQDVSEAGLKAFTASKFPAAAANIVEQAGYQGPIYNSFGWGGYLIWRLPQLPVSMDGRTNIHGDARVERSIATWEGKKDWQSDPDISAAGLVILEVNAPLVSFLRSDSRFRLVYEDQVAAVFVSNTKEMLR